MQRGCKRSRKLCQNLHIKCVTREGALAQRKRVREEDKEEGLSKKVR